MKKKLLVVGLIASLILSGCGGAGQGKGDNTEQASQVTAATEIQAATETQAPRPKDDRVSPLNTGKLQVKDGKLSDMAGNPVQLKGVSTHGIARVENFITQEMFEEMRYDWGVNIIRMAMYIYSNDGYTHDDYFKQKNNEIMRKGIELAIQNDMYVLIDWHVLDDKNPLRFKDEAKEFFDNISKEYKDCDNVIYEICNEPNNTEWKDIKEYANEIIPTIRANDPDSVIICGTPDWSQGIDQAQADPLEYDNLMYTLHFYAATHKDDLRNRMISCAEAGLPIFVTEYGVTASDGGVPRDLEEADKWMEAMDKYSISSCMWCLAKSGEACALITSGCPKFSGFEGDDFNETGEWFLNMLKK